MIKAQKHDDPICSVCGQPNKTDKIKSGHRFRFYLQGGYGVCDICVITAHPAKTPQLYRLADEARRDRIKIQIAQQSVRASLGELPEASQRQ